MKKNIKFHAEKVYQRPTITLRLPGSLQKKVEYIKAELGVSYNYALCKILTHYFILNSGEAMKENK